MMAGVSQPPVADALFLADGDRFVPTAHTRGPWDPDAQHGGPPAALIARAVEAVPAPEPVEVARLTVEILRPVPLRPLRVETRVSRPGRRVQLVEAVLSEAAGGTELCRAVALRIRSDPAAPQPQGDAGPPPPAPEQGRPRRPAPWLEGDSFPTTGVEMSFVSGDIMDSGPATVWIRLRHPLLEGEPPSPLARVAAAADFGNGVSSVLDWRTSLFINPDLSLHLVRECEGEWVCLDATTRIGAGRGLAESALHDRRGRIGRSLQSLYVDRR